MFWQSQNKKDDPLLVFFLQRKNTTFYLPKCGVFWCFFFLVFFRVFSLEKAKKKERKEKTEAYILWNNMYVKCLYRLQSEPGCLTFDKVHFVSLCILLRKMYSKATKHRFFLLPWHFVNKIEKSCYLHFVHKMICFLF